MDEHKRMEYFYEIFDASLPRLGPGDDVSTRKAFSLLTGKPLRSEASGFDKLRILDLGCGNGAQTIQLAKITGGTIRAVDNHQPFLFELQRRAEAEGVLAQIQPDLRDMRDIGPEDGVFDLIWCEGALFIMGLRQGLIACHSRLERGGLMAFSDLCWFKSDPPEECRCYFESVYPPMTDINGILETIAACGFEVSAHFSLPESAWWDTLYHPIEKRLTMLRAEYATDTERQEVIESIQREIDLYRKYSDNYGYEFFLMRRL